VLGQDRAHDLVEDMHRLPGFELALLRAQSALHFPDDLVIRCRHRASLLHTRPAALLASPRSGYGPGPDGEGGERSGHVH